MNSTLGIKRKSRQILQRYRVALGKHLAQSSDASLVSALELGRLAVTMGLETPDMALIHEQTIPLLKPDQSWSSGLRGGARRPRAT